MTTLTAICKSLSGRSSVPRVRAFVGPGRDAFKRFAFARPADIDPTGPVPQNAEQRDQLIDAMIDCLNAENGPAASATPLETLKEVSQRLNLPRTIFPARSEPTTTDWQEYTRAVRAADGAVNAAVRWFATRPVKAATRMKQEDANRAYLQMIDSNPDYLKLSSRELAALIGCSHTTLTRTAAYKDHLSKEREAKARNKRLRTEKSGRG